MKIKLIIGIGNPDAEYAGTYHNAGKMLAEWLAANNLSRVMSRGAEDAELEWKDLKLFSHVKTDSKPIIAKSNIFMNESGKAVAAAMKKFSLKPGEVAVAQDESDIELGKYKISFGRSSAGHKGAKSVIASLKTQDFWRIRIGVRKKKGRALDFVLRKISAADRAELEKVFGLISAELF